jgi:hypothetical protein
MAEEKEVDLFIIRDNTVPNTRYVSMFMANGGVCHTGVGQHAMHFSDQAVAEKQASELNKMRNRRTAYSVIIAATTGLR